MISYIWPAVLVVLSNTVYHLSAKASPEAMHPLASLAVTYSVGAVASLLLYLLLNKDGGFIKELSKLNWSPFVLGIAVVGLETGTIYAYRAGWPVSAFYPVTGAFLAIILLVIGFAFFKEKMSWNKIAGVIACVAGIALLNWK